MSKVIFERSDGGVTVRNLYEHTAAEAIADAIATGKAANTPIEVADTPAGDSVEYEFRGAWAIVAGEVAVDMPRARGIHMGRIREARDVALSRLDIDWMRQTGQGDSAAAQATENARQVLRDIPATFDLETGTPNPQALSARWPPGLDRPGR